MEIHASIRHAVVFVHKISDQSYRIDNHYVVYCSILTNDWVVLEEDVVAFVAADLEDEFTDVEQVVSTDAQLGRKIQKNSHNFLYKIVGVLCDRDK